MCICTGTSFHHEGDTLKRLSILLISGVFLMLAACGGEADETTAQVPTEKIQIEEFHYSQLPGGARIISGKLRNVTALPIENAQIQIGLFDADNRLISTVNVLVRDVPPGEAKPFREAVDSDDVDGAKVRGVLLM